MESNPETMDLDLVDDQFLSIDISLMKGEKSKEIQITVCDPVTKDSTFKNHTIYSVKGFDKDGIFETQKRYSEFDSVRTLLQCRWPGCLIPAIPPKKTMGNMDKSFIEERRKHLERFCVEVSKFPYLFYSEEFQSFLRSPDFTKTVNPLQNFTVTELITKYQKTFPHLENKEINDAINARITTFRTFLTKTLANFDTWNTFAKRITDAKKTFYQQFGMFTTHFLMEYEKNILTEYVGSDNGNIFNHPEKFQAKDGLERLKMTSEKPSIEYLCAWIRLERKELLSFSEAINMRSHYEGVKNTLVEKQKTETSDLHDALVGKTTLKSIFNKKSKEDLVAELEKQIEQTKKDIQTVGVLVDWITKILAYDLIEPFKQQKSDKYLYVLQKAGLCEIENNKEILEFWTTLVNEDKIKSIKIQ